MSRWQHVALGLILLVAALLRLHESGHAGIHDLDEVFHAIVARNLIAHPLTPTLYDAPALPFDFRNWQANHVWLHKPPVALWQMAASMLVFGESNAAMRLPSVVGATLAVALTFAIGRQLGDARAGLIAAAFQALNPFITRLVHGQVFSDHIDVALLAWTELAVLLTLAAARSGSLLPAILAGAAQGVAWQTKSHPALFVSGLAVALTIAGRWAGRGPPSTPSIVPALRLRPRQLAAFFIAAIAVALPWTLWCATQFPREFLHEQGHVVRHLYEDIEQFAAPWDRLLFDYLLRGLLEWWPLAAAALGMLVVDAIRRRDVARGFVALWAAGVLLPHVLATSKTPSATLIGWPAAWLAIGFVASDAIRGRAAAAGAILIAGALAAIWPQLPRASVMGYGPGYHFGSVMFEHWPLLAHAAAIAVAAAWCARIAKRPKPIGIPTAELVLLLALAAAGLIATGRHARLAWRTSGDVNPNPVAFVALGERVRDRMPRDAVFLVEAGVRNEHLIAMWWLDRTCYPLVPERFDDDVRTIRAAGRTPFVLARRPLGPPPVLAVEGEGAIYAVR